MAVRLRMTAVNMSHNATRIRITALAFVDWQKAIVECQGQEGHRRAEGAAELALPAAVVLLRLFELADELAVPFFPGRNVALEEGLGLVVARVFLIVAGRLLEHL